MTGRSREPAQSTPLYAHCVTPAHAATRVVVGLPAYAQGEDTHASRADCRRGCQQETTGSAARGDNMITLRERRLPRPTRP
jgi:hypothetical protein